MITDINSVFYRKAIIYKKRVDDELQTRNKRQSFTNDSSSLFSGSKQKSYEQSSPTNIESSKHNKTQTDTQALIREQKEMIKCQQFDPVSDEKERSGSFGAYKSYQRMLEKANENDSPEPFGRGST